MSHQFVFLCPACRSEDSVTHSFCGRCGAHLLFRNRCVVVDGIRWKFPAVSKWMRQNLAVEQDEGVRRSRLESAGDPGIDNPLRVSEMATLRQGVARTNFTGYAGLLQRRIEEPVKIARGLVVVSPHAFHFISPNRTFHFPLSGLTCITTNSQYFEFKMRGEAFYQIHFRHESPLKYEILFQKLLADFYAGLGEEILEYQPRIHLGPPRQKQKWFPVREGAGLPERSGEKAFIALLRKLVGLFLRTMLRIKIKGKRNIPANYSFIAILNHQSFFDPFIVLSFLDGRIAFLTKSTSFAHRFVRFFLKKGRAIPTTRYQTDPAVIWDIRRFLEHGIPVGIFPEGERCWHGERQAFKFSVVRLLLQTRIPIVIIRVKNTFDFLPRWRQIPRRKKIELSVNFPFCVVPDLFSPEEIKRFLESFFEENPQTGDVLQP